MDRELLVQRLAEQCDKLPRTLEGSYKAWVMGQLLGAVLSEKTVWTVAGNAHITEEMIREILDNLELPDATIEFQDGVYTINPLG